MNIGFSTPGMGTIARSQTQQFIWGGDKAQVIEGGYQIDSASVDSGSNNTKVLRPGLAMGRITATGLLKQFDNAATDGSQNLLGFLKEETPLIDSLGRTNSSGAFAQVIIAAPIKAKGILIGGVTLIGVASEAAIRAKIRSRFPIDDEDGAALAAGVNTFNLRQRVTLAQVNAGLTLLPAIAGLRYRVVDAAFIAIGGAVTGATTIDLLGTQATVSVKLLAAAVAGLTQSTVLRAGATNAAVLADGASFVANDTNTAISINKTGSNMATATHVDVLLTYEISA
jgi:hypothetical protein